MSQTDITPEQFLALYREEMGIPDAVVLDVREQPEWDYYHLKESVLMPLQTLPAGMASLPQDRPVYVVCAHGVRSQMACRYLRQHGFDNVINVEGGMAALAWLRGFAYD